MQVSENLDAALPPNEPASACRPARSFSMGAPEALTDPVLREIYGQPGSEALDERLTSTSLPAAALAAMAG